MNKPELKIMNELIELYERTPIKEIRNKIDKTLKPTEEERLKNAETAHV